MCMLVLLLFQLRDRLRRAAARGHPIETAGHGQGSNDVAVLAPACTVQPRRITQLYRPTSPHRNLLQLAGREEPDELPVSREEWTVSIFRPRQRLRLLLVKEACVEPHFAIRAATRVHNARAVR